MLQINSGKLFTRGVGHTNYLRGVLFSNVELYGFDVPTAGGCLKQTDAPSGSHAIVFEMEERIEAAEKAPGLIISHMIAPYLADFSALASFGLRAIVSPDAGLVDRLTSDLPGLASYHPPKKFVRRYFVARIPLRETEVGPIADLVDRLIALDRKSYLAAMRAIRTFVAGLHRMRDDLALSYTLLVSAIESLVQDFDAHETVWQDVDERKRHPVDRALKGEVDATADRIRDAIISAEHASLGRRYRAFVLSHIDESYFRGPDLVVGGAIARHELEEALRQAYDIRSRYVHNLIALPDAMELADSNFEVTEIDRKPTLTFEGLVRLTRHVIMQFIAAAPTTEHEPYDYTLELSSVISVTLAPEVWVGTPLKRASDARRRLEGHLEQLIHAFSTTEQTTITDLRPIFADIERLAKSSKSERRTLLTLYAMFTYHLLPKEEYPPRLDALFHEHMSEVGAPSSEALVARTLFGTLDAWSFDQHQQVLDNYLAQRSKKAGLHAPRILAAILCLALAERYRQAKQKLDAQALIAKAIDAYPGHSAMLALEKTFDARRRIDWRKILLPGLVPKKRKQKSPAKE